MTLGVVAFVLALLTSVMIHEFGHYIFAKRFGMKVTEFFVGFGPRIWSFVRGETEYGVKAIPAGGYVRIVGMTPDEPMTEEERARAFYSKSVPQRIIVLAAGSISHFIVGFLLIAFILGGLGTLKESTTIDTVSPCIPVSNEACTSSSQPSPAKAAGLRSGDVIKSVDGQSVSSWSSAVESIRSKPGQEVTLVVERADSELIIKATPVPRERPSLTDANATETVGVLGITSRQMMERQGIGTALVNAGSETGKIIGASVSGLLSIPSKIPSLWGQAFGQEERDPNSLVGVVGVARVSGQALGATEVPFSARLSYFLFIIASLNIFVGLFNAVPLPPLDGGHIAVAVIDGVKRRRAARKGLPTPEPFNITALAPLTYAVFSLLVALTVLLLAADILNPLSLGF